MGITVTAEEFEPMEIGPYEAKLVNVEEDPEGQFGPQYVWHFEVSDDDEEYPGRKLKAFSSQAFNPVSKPWKWVEALLGRKIEMGEQIDFDDLMGNRVTLHIDHKVTERGTFEKVKELTPVRKKRTKAEEKKAEEAEKANDEEIDDIPF